MTPAPHDPALRPRIDVFGVRLAGRWSGARIYRRERSPAFSASPVWWDTRQVWDHVIEVEVDVEDAEKPGSFFALTFAAPCYAHPEAPEALPFWRALLHRAALHEADESLRVGWAAPFDPHLDEDAQAAPVAHVHALTRAGCQALGRRRT